MILSSQKSAVNANGCYRALRFINNAAAALAAAASNIENIMRVIQP
jgi:hypothetical protein